MKFKADQTSQKLRGGYYTPQALADFVTRWVCEKNPASLVEPSCGDGVFLRSIAKASKNKDVNVLAYELFDSEVKKSKMLCNELELSNAKIIEGDFLAWANPELITGTPLFDGVLGNPPFIRYQFLEPEFQKNTENVFKTLGLKFTKHTNAWVPFLLACVALLKPNGRMGMVIPSEIIHVLHAQSLRTFLGLQCRKVVIIDPQEIWFEDTLQGAVIILAEKKSDIQDPTEGVGIMSVRGLEFLKTPPEEIFNETAGINGETVKGKWTKALLNVDDLRFISSLLKRKEVHNFKSIADVDVGIVTGANKFFLVDDETVSRHGLSPYVHPMFGRSEHCKGVIYDDAQHKSNKEKGNPSNFLYLDQPISTYPKNVQDYIGLGEQESLHTRYKCGIRTPWYKVPSVYSTRIGMLKRSHDTPRLISNQIGAYTTDTAYRIRAKNGLDEDLLVYCFINPLTAITAELSGRYYGGGVLELVPSEIENLSIPLPTHIDVDLQRLDEMIRTMPVEEVLLEHGAVILGAIGLTRDEVSRLVSIWLGLKNRRQRK